MVAAEVRSLAGRSANAAKEIKTLITASVERVERGTALVDEAGASMTAALGSIKRPTDIMGDIHEGWPLAALDARPVRAYPRALLAAVPGLQWGRDKRARWLPA